MSKQSPKNNSSFEPSEAGKTNILKGMFRLAIGRADAFSLLGSREENFLYALTPGLAIRLVLGFFLLTKAFNEANIVKVLWPFCTFLLVPVFIYEASRLFKRKEKWLRLAVAFLWGEWVLVFIGLISALVVSTIMMQPVLTVLKISYLFTGLYYIWLLWFMISRGLELGRGKTFLFLLLFIGFQIVLMILPFLFMPGYAEEMKQVIHQWVILVENITS